MGPSGDNTVQRQSQNLRNIVGHYIPFFERQQGLNENNFTRRFAQRLRELADSDEDTFQRYLCEGDAALYYDKRGQEKPWRAVICYDGYRFCGMVYAGFAWPVEIAGKKPQPGVGAYHFGLWEPIIEALRDGHIDELAELQVTPGTTEHDGKLFVLQSDGIALTWASSEAELKPDMFDDLFAPPSETNFREKTPALVAGSGS